LEAASPEKSLKKIIKSNKITTNRKIFNLSKYDNVYLVSFGKAADSMAKTVNSLLKIKSGIIVIPKSSKSVFKNTKFQVFNSSHPIPNQNSIRAAKAIVNFLQKRHRNEFVIFLVSGGGSSLVSFPAGITLSEKKDLTNHLLKCGATIQEFNCVRKHLSKIKGGMMLTNMKCDGVGLVISDVSNNDLSSISSGCTYFDNTTFKDAEKILKKYDLNKKISHSILKRLKHGSQGKIAETPKKAKIKNQIIMTNNFCLTKMAKKAELLGYDRKIVTISGNVNNAVKKLIQLIPKKKNSCVIFGGETTIKVLGKGKGGRNQELILRILQHIKKSKHDVVISSIGTDGIDGNTKYAGAIFEKSSIPSQKIDVYLKNNDSNLFFKNNGGLIKTGYTHTNLMDIGIILR